MSFSFETLYDVMVKVGALSFDTDLERDGFAKIAMGEVAPMMGNPAQMPPPAPAGQMQPPPPEAAEQMPATMISPEVSSLAGIGESITHKDIETLIKIVNLLSNLKNQYDAVKKDQVELIRTKMQEG